MHLRLPPIEVVAAKSLHLMENSPGIALQYRQVRIYNILYKHNHPIKLDYSLDVVVCLEYNMTNILVPVILCDSGVLGQGHIVRGYK